MEQSGPPSHDVVAGVAVQNPVWSRNIIAAPGVFPLSRPSFKRIFIYFGEGFFWNYVKYCVNCFLLYLLHLNSFERRISLRFLYNSK